MRLSYLSFTTPPYSVASRYLRAAVLESRRRNKWGSITLPCTVPTPTVLAQHFDMLNNASVLPSDDPLTIAEGLSGHTKGVFNHLLYSQVSSL